MARGAAALLVFLFVGLPGLPVSAASYTWGYGYQRQRAAQAPIAQDAAALPPVDAAMSRPFVVPLPGRSQSTPVVLDGRWYQWTYWAGGRRGVLWTGLLNRTTGTSSSGAPITLPGQAGPVVSATAAADLAEPADAAISPDGRWVAFGVGRRLYWWPVGDPAAGTAALITGPSHAGANSTSPTFIPDPRAPGGWEVCDGNWDGGFACFRVGVAGIAGLVPVAQYFVTWTSAADGNGYAPITSSAAYGGPVHELYFGVASATDPRVMALNPRTGAYLVMGGRGAVRFPVWAAVALDGDSVYATDVEGGAYRFNAISGRLLHWLAWRPSATDIVSPAVAGRSLYLVAARYGYIVRLDRLTLQVLSTARVGAAGATQASAPTVVSDAGVPPELFYAAENGGVRVLAVGPQLRPAGGWAGAPAGGRYDFTAAVVEGAEILLWSNGASESWGEGPQAPGPAGFGSTIGGIQVYHLAPRLSAWVMPAVVSTGQQPAELQVLAAPGARVAATGMPWAHIALTALTTTTHVCPRSIRQQAGKNFGVFPSSAVTAVGPPAGCGPLSQRLANLEPYASGQAGGIHPSFAGLSPSQWQAAGAGYAAWGATLSSPGTSGTFPVSVTATLPDGGESHVQVWLASACASGLTADASGQCTVPVPSPSTPARGEGASGSGRCAAGIGPGVGGMTRQEFSLLCLPPQPYLTDAPVVACYGSWWHFLRGVYAERRCVRPAIPVQG